MVSLAAAGARTVCTRHPYVTKTNVSDESRQNAVPGLWLVESTVVNTHILIITKTP